MTRTADEMLAEAREGQWLGGRKLTFTEKCGAFIALYDGVANAVVARAFGLASQTVSKLSGCLEYDPDPYHYEYATGEGHNPDLEMPEKVLRDHNARRSPNRHLHYNDVAREFVALGPEEFKRRYYTERTHKRIILAKLQLRDEAKAKARVRRGLSEN